MTFINSTAQKNIKTTVGVTTAILFFAWLIDYIDRLVITLALPSIGHEFHLDNAEKGAILSAFFLTYAFLQIPGGLLADRIGAKRTMMLAMTLWSVFTALTGAAVNYVMLIVIRVIFGASEGIFPGASMKAITERTTRKTRMTANGFMLCSNPFGAALSPLIAAPAIAMAGWRYSFFYIAGVGILVALVIGFWLPPKLAPKDREDMDQPSDQAKTSSQAPSGLRLLASGTMWKFALMFFGFDIVSWGLVSWVPDYLVTQRGASLSTAGIFASIPMFVATVAVVLGGLLFDRFFAHRHRWMIVPTSIISAVFLYLMIQSTTTAEFVTFESCGTLFMYLNFMPIYGLPLRMLPNEIAGSGSSLVNFGGQTAGLITPAFMGFLADQFSFAAAFSFLIFGAVLTVAASLWSPQTADAFRNALGDKLVSQ
jgi:MFS family permease